MEAKWYVYELLDPRDDSVFYVGKGSGKRIDAHEAEARKGVCSYKCNKIRHLWFLGLQIKKQVVAYFWNEQDAYEHEAERIASYAYTTNVVGGPCGKFVGPMPKVEEKPKEITLKAATKFLLVRPDLLAHYLVSTNGQRRKVQSVEITGLTPVWKKLYEAWFRLSYDFMYPTCLDKVIDSPTDWKKVQNALLPYGVKLENGCTN